MVAINAQLLPFANFALNNPDAAGLLAAIQEAGGAGSGGLSFGGAPPAGVPPVAGGAPAVFPPGAAPVPGADLTGGLGLALSGLQAQQPQQPVVLPPANIPVGGGVTDASGLLALLLRGRGGATPQPTLGQLIAGG